MTPHDAITDAIRSLLATLPPEQRDAALRQLDGEPLSTVGDASTLRQQVATWLKSALDGQTSSDTVRIYGSALRLAVDGVRLGRPGTTGGATRYAPWDPARTARWLAEARAANKRLELGRDIPALDRLPVDGDGVPILWGGLGDKPFTDITTADARDVALWATLRAATNEATKASPMRSSGASAHDTALNAMSRLFAHAADAEQIPRGHDPTDGVPRRRTGKRKRAEEHRVPLDDDQLEQVRHVWCYGGHDPVRDGWIFETGLWCGGRAEGLINLRWRHVDLDRSLIAPPDKNSLAKEDQIVEIEQNPVPTHVTLGLQRFAALRGSVEDHQPVLCNTDCSPITSRQLDTIYSRCRKQPPFLAGVRNFGLHTLRSTMAQRVELAGGSDAKKRFLRHADVAPSDSYGGTTLQELARIISGLSGEIHPLIR